MSTVDVDDGLVVVGIPPVPLPLISVVRVVALSAGRDHLQTGAGPVDALMVLTVRHGRQGQTRVGVSQTARCEGGG